MAEQNIQLKNQNGDMLFPLTKWNNIESRPSKLPNPASLTLGDVVYDGTETKIVEMIEIKIIRIEEKRIMKIKLNLKIREKRVYRKYNK